jgi:hypothetical protein
MDLTDFLLARIAEDEKLAGPLPGSLPAFGRDYGDPWTMFAWGYEIDINAGRLLADCAAKRRIVELHNQLPDDHYHSGHNEWDKGFPYEARPRMCSSCGDQGYNDFCGVQYPCDTLRALALPYASHPEYREEWRA